MDSLHPGQSSGLISLREISADLWFKCSMHVREGKGLEGRGEEGGFHRSVLKLTLWDDGLRGKDVAIITNRQLNIVTPWSTVPTDSLPVKCNVILCAQEIYYALTLESKSASATPHRLLPNLRKSDMFGHPFTLRLSAA